MKRALVVHSRDGLDEISATAPTDYARLDGDDITYGVIEPTDLLPSEETEGDTAGGTPSDNAVILRDILDGNDHTARRGMVVLNAAATCMVAGLGNSLADCIPLAERSIDTKAALHKLETLVEASRA